MTRRGFRAKKNVEKTTAPSEGSPAGSVSSSQKYYDGCVPDGLGESGRGVWSEEQRSWHINRLELLAVFLALRQFLLQLTGCHVLIRKDNMMVVSYLNRQGGLRSRPCTGECSSLGSNQIPVSQSSLISQVTWAQEQTCSRDRGWRTGSGDLTLKWWISYGRGTDERKWICSPLGLDALAHLALSGCPQ